MTFFNLLRDANPRHKFNHGGHVGTVIDNKDPEQLHRIKARLPIFAGIPDDKLPWIYPSSNKTSQTTKQVGTVNVPSIGAVIHVEFKDDSPYFPTYTGGVSRRTTKITSDFQLTDQQAPTPVQAPGTTGEPGTEGGSPPTEGYSGDYPHVEAEQDDSGSITAKNTKRDTFEYTHVSGTSIKIDGKGHISITVADKKVGPDAQEKYPKGLSLSIYGDISISSHGKTTIVSEGDMSLGTNGNLSIKAKGDIDIATSGALHMSATGVASIDAGSPVRIGAPELITPPIIDGVPAELFGNGGGAGETSSGSPASVDSIPAVAEPPARSRPESVAPTGQTDYGDSSSAPSIPV